MADILLSPILHLVLLICAVFFTAVAVSRKKILWAVLAALCTISVCLLGLAAERSLEQLLTAVLIPTAMVLCAQRGKEGGSEA